MKEVLITGGTGLIGRRLTALLTSKGYTVTILTRSLQGHTPQPGVRYALWDVGKGQLDAASLERAQTLVHLAGAGVMDKPWTKAYKQTIADSRVHSANLLVKALQEMPNSVDTVISGSAIGFYKESGWEHASIESDQPAPGFLGETCVAWEQAMAPVEALGKRLVYIRTGIVLSPDGGALPEFLKPLQFRVAGVLGSGNQVVSWIHIDDLCSMILFAIENQAWRGAYNGVGPSPVSNAQLNKTLGKVLYGNAFISMPVPSLALKLLLGARSIEVLKSANVSAGRAMAEGFVFQHPALEPALIHLLGK